RTADLRALVPVHAQPTQRVQDGGVALHAVACGVGVLDPEHEVATHVPGVGPVEERRPNQSDVWGAGGRRAEPDPDVWRVCHHFFLRTTGLDNVPIPSIEIDTVSPSS